MPLKFHPHHTPAPWFRIGVMSLLVLNQSPAADSVAGLAEREAAKRQMKVNSAGADLQRASNLMAAGKTEEALQLLESTYSSLPEAPLTHELKAAARAGYVSAGCIRAEELMANGKRPEADELLTKLLTASPNDKQVIACKNRLADPDRYPPALTSEHVDNVKKVEALLLKANSAIEIGDYDLATRLYQDVLRIDRYNNAARRGMERVEQLKGRYYQSAYDQKRASMLKSVDQLWEDPVPPSNTDLNALFGARVSASAISTGGRESILDKLRSFRLPSVEFEGATVPEVIELLRLRSRDLDPSGIGIDFVLNLPDDLKTVQVTLSLRDVPMEEALRYVTEMAGVSYHVEPRAVVLSSLGEKNSALITRSYRVPPDFIQNAPATPAAANNADPFAANTAPAGAGLVLKRMGAKEFLESRGVQFPDGASASYSTSTSMLMVRNTTANHDLVETLVEQVTKNSPKQVIVTVKMLEVNQSNLDELGFDWMLAGIGLNGDNVGAGGGSTGNGVPFNSSNYPFRNTATIPAYIVNDTTLGFPFEAFPAQPVDSALGGPVPLGVPNGPLGGGGGPLTSGLRSGTYAAGVNSLDSLLRSGSATGKQAPAPGILSLAGVFTDPQFQTVLRGLNQKKGVDISACPSVTTKSGVKATMELVREFIYPTEFDPPQLPQGNFGSRNIFTGGGGTTALIATPTTPTAFEMRKVGAMVEVEPVISDDSRTIELVIAPELTDFEGFVNYGSPILSPGSSSYLPISGGAFAIATDYLGNPVKPSAAVPITVIPVPLLGKPLPLNPVAPFPYVAYPPPGAPAPYNPPSGFPGPWWITHDILRWLPFLQPEQLITPNYILQPVFKKQKVSTSVRIWDGQTVVLGGVKKQEHTLVEDAVPILGDLPFIGRLFRTNTKKTDTKNVVIFVTAEIIDPTGQKIRRSTQSTSTTP